MRPHQTALPIGAPTPFCDASVRARAQYAPYSPSESRSGRQTARGCRYLKSEAEMSCSTTLCATLYSRTVTIYCPPLHPYTLAPLHAPCHDPRMTSHLDYTHLPHSHLVCVPSSMPCACHAMIALHLFPSVASRSWSMIRVQHSSHYPLMLPHRISSLPPLLSTPYKFSLLYSARPRSSSYTTLRLVRLWLTICIPTCSRLASFPIPNLHSLSRSQYLSRVYGLSAS